MRALSVAALLFLLHLGGPFGALGVGLATSTATMSLLKGAHYEDG